MKLNQIPLAITGVLLIAAALHPLNIIPLIVLAVLSGAFYVYSERHQGFAQALEERISAAEARAEESFNHLLNANTELAKLRTEVDSISKKLAFK